MIKLENVEVFGWEAAIRGMRNPMNSWEKSDSSYDCADHDCRACRYFDSETTGCLSDSLVTYIIGPNDSDLMMGLANGGSVHAKYRRMIQVVVDITAPLYWWKEFDTYKVGTVANSCSTMHKIHAKEFTIEDFSHEKLFDGIREDHDCFVESEIVDWESIDPSGVLELIIQMLNKARELYLHYKKMADEGDEYAKAHVKDYWWQMIQLLPSSYNQRRTVMLSYEVLSNIYPNRKDHKLDEWRDFCKYIETLPYSEIITLKGR